MITFVLTIIISFASFAALLSLCVYIFLAVRGDSLLLYSTSHPLLLSWWKKLFLAFAALAFLICMFKGAEAMLWWVPASWGSLDSDGEYHAVRISLATLFLTFGGLAFVQFIDSAIHDKFFIRIIVERSKELEAILNASINAKELTVLKKRYEGKLANIKLEECLQSGFRPRVAHLLPERRREEMYREFICYIEKLESKEKVNLYKDDIVS